MALRRWGIPLLLLLAAPAAAAAPSFGDPTRIVTGHHQAGFDVAVTDSTVFVAWINYDDTTAHDLWFTSMTHAGVPLVTRALMTGSTLSLHPSIAVDGALVGIAWIENDHDHPGVDDTLYFQRSTDGGATWKPRLDLAIPDLGFQDATPRLLAQGGRLYLGYEQFGDIMLLRSDDAGVSWLPAVVVAKHDTSHITNADLFMDASRLYATYLDDYRVAVRTSTDAGGTWSSPAFLTDGSTAASSPTISGDGNRTVVTWWQHYGKLKPYNGRVYARVSTDGGTSFKPVRRVSGPIPASAFGGPEVTFALGRFAIVWQDRDSGLRLAFSPRGLFWLNRMKLPATSFGHDVAGTSTHLWVVYDAGDDIEGVHATE